MLHWHLSRSIDVSLFRLKKLSVKAPKRVGAELQLPSGTSSALADFCVCSPFAVYTCWCKPAPKASRDITDSVPQRRRRRRRWCRWWLQGQETWGPERCLFLLFTLKGDLKWSDPPRFIPVICVQLSLLSQLNKMFEKLLGTKSKGISSLSPVRVETEASSFFFFSFSPPEC